MNNVAIKKEQSPLHATLTLLILGITAYLLKLGFNIYLARKLPAAIYGDFAVAIKVLNVAATIILLGTNVSASRFLSRYIVLDDQYTMQDYLSWNVRIVLASSFFCFIILIFILGILYFLHISNILRLEELHLAMHILWISPLAAMALLLSSFLLCNRKYHLSYFFNHFANYIFMSFFILVGLYFFDSPIDTHYLVGMVLFAFIMMILLETITFRAYMPKALLTSLKNAWQTPKTETREWTMTSIRLIGNGIMYSVITTIDLLIVEIISPHEETVAYFAAALVVANIIFVIPNSIYNYLKPQISTAIANKNYAVLQKKLGQANSITYAATFLIAILINLFAAKLFSFFGDQFAHAAQITLLILSVGYFIGALCKPAVLLLTYSGHEKIMMKITIVELCAVTILGFILTYFYGIEGAALAGSIAIVLKSLLAYIYAKRLFPLRPCCVDDLYP